jgi:hypothetical protein
MSTVVLQKVCSSPGPPDPSSLSVVICVRNDGLVGSLHRDFVNGRPPMKQRGVTPIGGPATHLGCEFTACFPPCVQRDGPSQRLLDPCCACTDHVLQVKAPTRPALAMLCVCKGGILDNTAQMVLLPFSSPLSLAQTTLMWL